MVGSNLYTYAIGCFVPASNILASLRTEYLLLETRLRISTIPSIRCSQINIDRCHSRTIRQVRVYAIFQKILSTLEFYICA